MSRGCRKWQPLPEDNISIDSWHPIANTESQRLPDDTPVRPSKLFIACSASVTGAKFTSDNVLPSNSDYHSTFRNNQRSNTMTLATMMTPCLWFSKFREKKTKKEKR
jgi:hypothetical protein